MEPIQFVSTELEELRRTVRRLDMENAILRDILASAIEIADIAILMANEQSKLRQADCDTGNDNVRPIPQAASPVKAYPRRQYPGDLR